MRIFYLCDGERACSSSPSCGMTHSGSSDGCSCFHTLQAVHAKNGTLDQNPGVRPFFVQDGDDIWEGFIGTGKK